MAGPGKGALWRGELAADANTVYFFKAVISAPLRPRNRMTTQLLLIVFGTTAAASLALWTFRIAQADPTA